MRDELSDQAQVSTDEQKAVKPKEGVMLATPVRSWQGVEQLHPIYQEVLKRLAVLSSDESCPYEFQFCTATGGICKARNEIVQNFRRQRVFNPWLRWLFWWDDDVFAPGADGGPDADATVAALLRLLSHRRPICGGLYCTREENSHWAANFMAECAPDKKGLLQTAELACGFKLYFYQTFDVLQAYYPTLKYFKRDTGEEVWGFFQQVVMNEDAPPEDYFLDWLCREAKGAKIGIWCDPVIKLVHVGADGEVFPKNTFPPIPGVAP